MVSPFSKSNASPAAFRIESASNLKLAVDVESIQFVSPNVAVEHGTASFLTPDAQPEETEYSAVYVRRDGKWLLDRVTDVESLTRSANYEHLKETGISNLTKDEAPALIHFADGQTQKWLLVRLEDPEGPAPQ